MHIFKVECSVQILTKSSEKEAIGRLTIDIYKQSQKNIHLALWAKMKPKKM